MADPAVDSRRFYSIVDPVSLFVHTITDLESYAASEDFLGRVATASDIWRFDFSKLGVCIL